MNPKAMLTAGTAALCAALAGCGGSAPTTYKAGAFKACVEQGGASVLTYSVLVATGANPAAIARQKQHMPGGFDVHFASGEDVLFYFASDSAGAEKAKSWILTEAASGGVSGSSGRTNRRRQRA